MKPSFPQEDIRFLQGIRAVSTKFNTAETMGPQGQKHINNGKPVNTTLWFKFQLFNQFGQY